MEEWPDTAGRCDGLYGDTLMPLPAWQERFLELVNKGKNETDALKEVNATIHALDSAKKDPEFREIYERVRGAGAGSGILCVAELERLRQAQVSDARAAGYFGMTLEEFRDAVNNDPVLRKVNETAIMKGQAQLQVAQYEKAIMENDGDMQKWIGANSLGQSTKVETKHEVEQTISPEQAAKMLAFLHANPDLPKIVDAEFSEIQPEPQKALEHHIEKSDNDLGPT